MDITIKDAMSKLTFGVTLTESWARGTCVDCKEKATWYSAAGEREYKISGLCESCFDKITQPGEDDVI